MKTHPDFLKSWGFVLIKAVMEKPLGAVPLITVPLIT